MRKIVSSIILVLLILSGCSGSQTEEEQVTDLINNYLEALKTNDKSKLVKYSDDIRFPDKKKQKEEYLSIEQDITDAKIVWVNQVTDTEFETMIEVVADGELYQPKFSVEKQKKGWKVIVGQDL